MSDIVASMMKLYIKSSDPQEPFGTFHNQLATALNSGINRLLNMQRHVASGATTYPGTPVVVVPLTAPCVWPVTPFMISGPELIAVTANQDENNTLKNIFDLIGKKISLMVSWQGNPVIVGAGAVSLITTHFGTYGSMLEKVTKLKDVNSYNAEQFWNDFDNYLSLAINSTPPAIGPLVGAVGPGVFTGTMTIKLIV